MKLRFYLGTRDQVWSLRIAMSFFRWVVLTFKVAPWHLKRFRMHLAQQSLKIAASPSQGEVSVPRRGLFSTRPCTHSKAFAAKAVLSGASP